MKQTVSIISALAQAQGNVTFQNIVGTGLTGGSPITNCFTGQRIPAGFAWVHLWYGAAGIAEDQLRPNGNIVANVANGLCAGGTRTLDAAVVGASSPSTAVLAALQVRWWQQSLGMTWAEAEAGISTGGGGVTGKSRMFTITTGNPCAMPPGIPANMSA